jgi:hypothetical protein
MGCVLIADCCGCHCVLVLVLPAQVRRMQQ